MTQPLHVPRILVFDSGVGGLSIVSEIRKTIADINIIYVADNAAFPYGTKEEDWLNYRVATLLQPIVDQYLPDLIVVACNTASTTALPTLRSVFDVPIIGTVPAIKPAAQLTKTKVIGILGTPGTIKRDYTQNLIDEFASDCRIIRHGSSELVHLAEQKLAEEISLHTEIEAALQDLFTQDAEGLMDVCVLACTHFPLLTSELSAASNGKISWIDSGEAIARRVQALLNDLDQPPPIEPTDDLAIITAPWPLDRPRPFSAFGFPELRTHLLPA